MCLDVLCSVHLTDLNIDFSRIQVVERLIHTEAQLPLCLVKSTQQACTFQHAYWHLVEHGTVDCHSTAWKYCPAPNHMTARGEHQLLLVMTVIAIEVTIIMVVQQSSAVSNECSSFHSSWAASCCACESALNLLMIPLSWAAWFEELNKRRVGAPWSICPHMLRRRCSVSTADAALSAHTPPSWR